MATLLFSILLLSSGITLAILYHRMTGVSGMQFRLLPPVTVSKALERKAKEKEKSNMMKMISGFPKIFKSWKIQLPKFQKLKKISNGSPKQSKEQEDKKVGGNDTEFSPNPEKLKIASGMVRGSVIKRRNEQGVNWYIMILAVLALFGAPYWWMSSVARKQEQAAIRQAAYQTAAWSGLLGTPSTPDNVSVGDPLGSMITSWPVLEYTPTPTPAFTVTPEFTPTPQITPTPTAGYFIYYIFKYSYYNPKLGGANCLTWDSVIGDCVSFMANGEDWHNQYGIAVACPPEFALGTTIEVLYPESLSGIWVCKDRGGAIVGNYIDFLDITQRYQWNEPVSARVYPPTTPLQQITQGTH